MIAQLAGRHGVRALAQANAEVVPREPAPAVRFVTEVSAEAQDVHIEVRRGAKISNRQDEPSCLESSHCPVLHRLVRVRLTFELSRLVRARRWAPLFVPYRRFTSPTEFATSCSRTVLSRSPSRLKYRQDFPILCFPSRDSSSCCSFPSAIR